MTTDTYTFLRELAANNNRPWFQIHKAEYEEVRSRWLADLDRLIAAMSVWMPRISGLTGRDVAYRIYRDTRFSPDKTPYKTYLSAGIGPYGRSSHRAGFYVQLDPLTAESGLYAGLWCPDAPMLRKMRHAIVDNIEEFEETVNSPEATRYFGQWVGNTLKTIPKGWPKDHPQAWALRMKDYGKFCPAGEDFFTSETWPEEAASRFETMKPFVDFINYSLDED